MKTPTPEGVKPAKENEKRYTIECIHNADAEHGIPKLVKMLSKSFATPEQMYEMLGRPDVQVTNDSDKDKLRPIVRNTDAHVKEMMRSDFYHQILVHQNLLCLVHILLYMVEIVLQTILCLRLYKLFDLLIDLQVLS